MLLFLLYTGLFTRQRSTASSPRSPASLQFDLLYCFLNFPGLFTLFTLTLENKSFVGRVPCCAASVIVNTIVSPDNHDQHNFTVPTSSNSYFKSSFLRIITVLSLLFFLFFFNVFLLITSFSKIVIKLFEKSFGLRSEGETQWCFRDR